MKRLKIEKMVYGGYGLSRLEGMTYLITGGYPHEEVEVETIKCKKDVCFAEVKRVLTPSKWRRSVNCKHFEKCGGCEWMNVTYKKQLDFKREILVEQMRRIAKKEMKTPSIIPTPEFHYRNKAEFVVQDSKLGFFKRGTHQFIHVNECMIVSKKINEAKTKIEKMLKAHPKFSSKLDHVVIKEGEGQVMVIFTSTSEITPPYIEGIDSVVTLKRKNRSHVVISGKEKVHQGREKVDMKINGVKYAIPSKSFFQVNTEGAKILAKVVRDYAGSSQKALDLYCGVGFFSLQIHDNFESVMGIESSPSSVKVAKSNAELNGFSNVTFQVKKVEEWYPHEKFDVVILDPPRSGLKKKMVEKVVTIASERIVYVSCDSSTFARDTKHFEEMGFVLKDLTLVDMFPQTHHFEMVSLLEKIEKGN